MDFKVGQSFGEPQPSGISIANRLPRLVNSPARAKGQPGSSALFFALTNVDTRQWYWPQTVLHPSNLRVRSVGISTQYATADPRAQRMTVHSIPSS